MSKGPDNFNALARPYRWLEYGVFGKSLEQCRFNLIDHLADAQRVLTIGEGDGRFVTELVRQFPHMEVDCLEGSSAMIVQARARLPAEAKVNFYHVNALEWEYPAKTYDVVVTCFFLDCFTDQTLQEWMPRVVNSSKPNGKWVVAEFREVFRGAKRLRSRFWLKVMYRFFDWTTGLEAKQLPDWQSTLNELGYSCFERAETVNSMFQCSVWHRENARKMDDIKT